MKWKCPACGSTQLSVVAQMWVDLLQEASGEFRTVDSGSDHDWSADSVMICKICDEQDIAERFELPAGTVEAQISLRT